MEDLYQALKGVNGDGIKLYRFSFSPAGTGSPTLVGGKYVKTITRSAAGLFLVTLNATFAAVLGVWGSVRDTAAGGLVACMGVQLDPANTTLVATNPNVTGSILGIRTVNTSGANTDYTATTTGSQIDVVVLFGQDPNNLL